MVGLVFLISLLQVFSLTSQEYCYSTDPSPYREYATKTSYADRIGKHESELKNEGCEPVMIYLLARHGYRYPGDDDIEEMIQLLPALKQHILNDTTMHQLCNEDVEAIRNWTLRMVPDDDKELTAAGKMDHLQLATRYKTKLPSLLDIPYTEADFKFRHSDKHRTRDSAKYFARGLFDPSGEALLLSNINMEVKKSKQDFVLRYYKNCDKFEETVDDLAVEELVEFEKGPVVQEVLHNITARLGLTQTLNMKSVKTLWRSCSMEHGIFDQEDTARPRTGSGSPWCAAFTSSELKIVNYMMDLEDYWLTSYGHQINYEKSCPLVQDIVKWVRMGSSGNSSAPKAVLRFGHSETIAPLVTKIGLFKDALRLTADEYDYDRMWRDSHIVPMAANVAFVVYNCSGTMKFKMIINEQETLYPGCEQHMCDINTFMSSLGMFGDTCDFDEICDVKQQETTPVEQVEGTTREVLDTTESSAMRCLSGGMILYVVAVISMFYVKLL